MLSEREAQELLSSGAVTFAPLKLELIGSEKGRADWLIDLSYEAQTKTFAAEYSRFSTPLSLSQATAQIRRAVGEPGPLNDNDLLPLVMAPYLDEEALNRLLDEKVSGVDFSGNGVIYVPGEWFILKTGASNKYPSSRPIKKIYEGKSSLVGRTMLLEREFETVSDVYDAISRRGSRIALSTVSKVLSALEEELLISKEPSIRLLQPDRLLRNLRRAYKPPTVEGRLIGKAPLADGTLQTLVAWAKSESERLAVDATDRYVLMPSSRNVRRVYVSRLENISSLIDLDTESPFPDLEVTCTSDPTVFFDLRLENGIPWTPPLQVYLQLANGDKREQQTADQLEAQLLNQTSVE